MHPVEHFKTVYEHRKLVREHCFRLGLYRQGKGKRQAALWPGSTTRDATSITSNTG